MTSGSVRLGETAIDYEESDGFVTIPVTEAKGTIYCAVEPNDTSYLLSYAKMQYTLGGDSKSEVIGIVNLQTEMLTLNVPNEVKTKTVHISGFANPKSEVSVYLDDEFVDTFTASAVGNYSADVSLANPEQGKFYAIEVKSTDNSGNEITALDYVQYNTKSPELTQFTMYYRNSEYDLIELSGTSPIVSWAANTTFTFIIDFDDNKNMDVVKVVSTKGNEVRTITAVYDPENDYYIATGFYNYIPGTLSVEYKEYPDFSKLEGVTVETEDTYTLDDSEKTNGYLVRLDMMDEKGSSLYYYEELEQDVEFELTDNLMAYSQNGVSYYIGIDEEWFYRDNGIFLGKECYVQNSDGTYDVYRNGIGMFAEQDAAPSEQSIRTSLSSNGKPELISGTGRKTFSEKAKKVAKKAADSVVEKAFEEADLKDIYDNTKEILDILDTNVGGSGSGGSIEDELYTSLNNILSSIDESQLDAEAQLQVQTARTELEMYKLINGASSVHSSINKYIDHSFSLSGDVIVPGSSKLNSKFKKELKSQMKDCVNAMEDAEKSVGNRHLSHVMEILTDHKWFQDSLLEKMTKLSMDNYDKASKESTVNFAARYSVDPSGYVYEGVKSNRVSGVEATIYYKATEDAEPVVWDASEYDQKNPLYSDENGAYAWDVPEGLWQVVFTKEGYETASTEWLPVPPEQLEVNVELISKFGPSLQEINVYDVDISTVNEDTVVFQSGDEKVNGMIEPVHAETSASDESVQLAKEFRFIPAQDIRGDITYDIHDIVNYAGKTMQAPFTDTIELQVKVESLTFDSLVEMVYKDEKTVTIHADPSEAVAGQNLLLTTDNSYAISIPENVTFDENGDAFIAIKSLLPGKSTIKFMLDGTNTAGSIVVIAAANEETPIDGFEPPASGTDTTPTETTTTTTSATETTTTTTTSTTTTTTVPTETTTTSTTDTTTATPEETTTALPTESTTTTTSTEATTTQAEQTTTTLSTESTTASTDTTTQTTPSETMAFGDVDNSGNITIDDATMTLQVYTNQMLHVDAGVSDDVMKAMDLDEDGAVTIDDATYILAYYTAESVTHTPMTWYEITGNPNAPGAPE